MSDATALIIAAGGFLSILAGLYATFRKGKTEDTATVQAALAERASLKQRIDEHIDTRVAADLQRQDERLAAQDKKIADQDEKIADLERNLKTERRRNGSIKRVVQRWFYQLRAWDREGRPGTLPMPSDDDMLLLELDRDPSDDDAVPAALVQPMRDIVAEHDADASAGL